MTREEEIKYESSFYQLSNSREKFIEGARWADQHPRKGLVDIEKVCEWWSEVPDDTYGFNPCRIYIDDFRKAMEEQ